MLSLLIAEAGEGSGLGNFACEVTQAIVVELEVVILKRGHVEDLGFAVRFFQGFADNIRRVRPVVDVNLCAYLYTKEEENEKDTEGDYGDDEEEATTLRLLGDSTTQPESVRRTMCRADFELVPIKLKVFHFSCSLLANSLREGAKVGIRDNQVVILLILNLSQLLLNCRCLLKLGLAQVVVPLLQQVQHLSVVEGKRHVCNLALLLRESPLHQDALYLLDQILLETPDRYVVSFVCVLRSAYYGFLADHVLVQVLADPPFD